LRQPFFFFRIQIFYCQACFFIAIFACRQQFHLLSFRIQTRLHSVPINEGAKAVGKTIESLKLEDLGAEAEVLLHGDTLDEARAHALALAESQGLTLVHPYDDPDIVAGQGTVGLEMLRQQPDLETLVVATGGGGLIAGVTLAAQALRAKNVAPDSDLTHIIIPESAAQGNM